MTKTRQQLITVILLDTIKQAIDKGWTEAQFKACLRQRLSETGQTELPV